MFNKTPICEFCQKMEATSFSHFQLHKSTGASQGWLFTCKCTEALEDYVIRIENFFSSPPATIDWLAHMNEKTWMDWSNFMMMIDRFRTATDSFNQN